MRQLPGRGGRAFSWAGHPSRELLKPRQHNPTCPGRTELGTGAARSGDTDPEHTQPCPDHWEREVAPSPDWELFTVNSPPVSAGSMVGVSTQQRWPCTGSAPASAAERFPPKQEPIQDPLAAPAREGLSQAPRGSTGTIRGTQ